MNCLPLNRAVCVLHDINCELFHCSVIFFFTGFTILLYYFLFYLECLLLVSYPILACVFNSMCSSISLQVHHVTHYWTEDSLFAPSWIRLPFWTDS